MDMASGPRFSYSYRVNPKHRWTLTYSSLTDADLGTIETFFNSMHGRYGSFEFTDTEGTTYSSCRFDQDSLDVNYIGPNQSSVQLIVVEIGF
jgi:hypothetical protein